MYRYGLYPDDGPRATGAGHRRSVAVGCAPALAFPVEARCCLVSPWLCERVRPIFVALPDRGNSVPDTFDRLKTALADRYAIEGQSGVGRLTTAKAAARLSVAESDVRRRQFTDRLPSREFTRGTTRSAT